MQIVLNEIPQEWTIERSTTNGDLLVKVNGWTYATLHYNYSYTSNAEQWAVAAELVKLVSSR